MNHIYEEHKTLSVRENRANFISYRLKNGESGEILEPVILLEFWTRVITHQPSPKRTDD